jgi:hypothetical protein
MKVNYYKCDECEKEFKSENPDFCPNCNSREWSQITKKSNPLKWIIGLVILMTIPAAIYYMPVSDPSIVTYELKENYIQFSSNYIDANIELKDYNSDRIIFNKGNKFYPCDVDDSQIVIYFDNANFKLQGNQIIEKYSIEGDVHSNACSEQLSIQYVKAPNHKCEYYIVVNDAYSKSDDIELSMNGSDYFNRKFMWTQNEIGQSHKVYARLASDKNKITSFEFTNSKCSNIKVAPTADKIINCFANLKSNNRDKSFRKLLAPYKNKLIISYLDKERSLSQFMMFINASRLNNGVGYIDNLEIKPSSIKYNSDKSFIIKITIYES